MGVKGAPRNPTATEKRQMAQGCTVLQLCTAALWGYVLHTRPTCGFCYREGLLSAAPRASVRGVIGKQPPFRIGI